MKRWLLLLTFLALVMVCGCISENQTNESLVERDTIYIIYSPTCPHCHYLINYIESKSMNITVVKTTEGGKYVKFLESHGIKWDGGVPLLFVLLKNETLVVVNGYPTESQEKNGYFFGVDYEKSMCEKMSGKPFYENGEYKFCKLPNGMLLGNMYSVDYVIGLCEKDLYG